ncbi:hypothetical protein [Clostridium cuniculi]|uniref:hypothetical protein n=1 Tax=Clostridium cuniculi TaxID=2548455 RepID=UPI001054895F|nr:hypothetical protein [Clostridium cuniculi]
MNKKRIGALLIGATLLVGALGSFAYFTANADLQGNGANGELQAIQITNGRVVVTADITGEGTELSDWTYDVARLSSANAGIEINEYFENTHRNPDIDKVDKEATADGIERAVIGASLPDVINFTRPGDAIVLGSEVNNEDGTTSAGLNIDVDSNLTIKMRVIATDVDGDNKNGLNNPCLDSLEEAGWKLYVNNVEKSFEELKKGLYLEPVDQLLQIRFELPLDTTNEYQDKQTLTDVGGTGFDLSKLIEIQATQENNRDWEQVGQPNYVPAISLPENN